MNVPIWRMDRFSGCSALPTEIRSHQVARASCDFTGQIQIRRQYIGISYLCQRRFQGWHSCLNALPAAIGLTIPTILEKAPGICPGPFLFAAFELAPRNSRGIAAYSFLCAILGRMMMGVILKPILPAVAAMAKRHEKACQYAGRNNHEPQGQYEGHDGQGYDNECCHKNSPPFPLDYHIGNHINRPPPPS